MINSQPGCPTPCPCCCWSCTPPSYSPACLSSLASSSPALSSSSPGSSPPAPPPPSNSPPTSSSPTSPPWPISRSLPSSSLSPSSSSASRLQQPTEQPLSSLLAGVHDLLHHLPLHRPFELVSGSIAPTKTANCAQTFTLCNTGGGRSTTHSHVGKHFKDL